MRPALLALLIATLVGCPSFQAQAAPAKVTVGVLKFGTVSWVLDTIERNGLDKAEGIDLDVVPLAAKTERGLIHFCSGLDLAILGLLTAVVGTTDGWHSPSAGLVGFHPEGLVLPGEEPTGGTSPDPSGLFREIDYRFRWLLQFHYGGHFGYANRVWACETLGRLIAGPDEDRAAAAAEEARQGVPKIRASSS